MDGIHVFIFHETVCNLNTPKNKGLSSCVSTWNLPLETTGRRPNILFSLVPSPPSGRHRRDLVVSPDPLSGVVGGPRRGPGPSALLPSRRVRTTSPSPGATAERNQGVLPGRTSRRDVVGLRRRKGDLRCLLTFSKLVFLGPVTPTLRKSISLSFSKFYCPGLLR